MLHFLTDMKFCDEVLFSSNLSKVFSKINRNFVFGLHPQFLAFHFIEINAQRLAEMSEI